MQCSQQSDKKDDCKPDEGEACTETAIRMATLENSEVCQSCHDIHECSVCSEGGRGGRGGRGQRGWAGRKGVGGEEDMLQRVSLSIMHEVVY